MLMNAMQLNRFGGPETLKLAQVERRQPGAGEIEIRVIAAGVNPVDVKMREGKAPQFLDQSELPAILGRDAAGEISAVGPGVETWQVGQRCFAMMPEHEGAYGEYVTIAADKVVAIPDALDFITAGGVPLASLTAWQGLFDNGKLERGQRVLIHAGAGGVGHFAVQFAKVIGAYIFATASEKDLPFVKDLGADVAIDYKNERFEDVATDLDLVFDTISGETRERSWNLIKAGGRLITTLDEPDPQKASAHNIVASRFTAQSDGADLAKIAALIGDDKVRPHVSRTFALEQAADAQEQLKQGGIAGKIVLSVADESKGH